mmetsp:Transcript_21209/g.31498  ORF Transcript_21209/g.31498 Transcript_21209/m.31498 type:complete len:95 (-) Transcript_21209:113-397(-)
MEAYWCYGRGSHVSSTAKSVERMVIINPKECIFDFPPLLIWTAPYIIHIVTKTGSANCPTTFSLSSAVVADAVNHFIAVHGDAFIWKDKKKSPK